MEKVGFGIEISMRCRILSAADGPVDRVRLGKMCGEDVERTVL